MKKLPGLLLFFLLQGGFAQEQVEAIMDKGYNKYLEEDYQGAILDFQKALSYDSTNAEIYYLIGACKSIIGETKAAMESLDKAISLRPDYAAAYYEKGYIYLTDQNAEKAIEAFDKTIQYNPDFPEAYVSRGTAKCMLGDKEGAAKDWARAKELGVNYGEYMTCD